MMKKGVQDDTLMRLSSLAEQTGVSIHCIRTYVDQGMVRVNERTAGGLLLFYEPAVERVRFIRTARAAGVPVAKIARLLMVCDQGDDDGATTSLLELDQYIQDTRSNVNAFEQSLAQMLSNNNLTREVV